jgi:hypothetical protein
MSAFPELLKPFAGRIIDIDSHEHMPAQVWVENFGDVAKPLADVMMSTPPTNPNHANVQGYPGDVREISEETLWTTKGPISPGAVDMSRRVQVMDMMKIDRQLMFPTSIGLWGTSLSACPEDLPLYKRFGEQSYSYAKQLFAANNEWAVGAAKVSRNGCLIRGSARFCSSPHGCPAASRPPMTNWTPSMRCWPKPMSR